MSTKVNGPRKGAATFTEVEFGPHFLTFYSSTPSEMLKDATKVYHLLSEELQGINPKALTHVTGDPNMYHPYGNPHEFPEQRKYFRHFHIRYGRKPTLEDLADVPLINLDDDIPITSLEDLKLPGTENLIYPELWDPYEDYIEYLRKGQWRVK